MRISDWSSDVCSSDLPVATGPLELDEALPHVALDVGDGASGQRGREIGRAGDGQARDYLCDLGLRSRQGDRRRSGARQQIADRRRLAGGVGGQSLDATPGAELERTSVGWGKRVARGGKPGG